MHLSVAPPSHSEQPKFTDGHPASDLQSPSNSTAVSSGDQHCRTTSPAPFSSTYWQAADEPPDVVLVARDQTRLYAHARRLRCVSANAWGGLLASTHSPVACAVPEDAQTTQLVLHVVYDLPCLHLAPTLEGTERALAALRKYGAAVARLAAAPHVPLHSLVLAHAPARPAETYALASEYALDAVAVAASAHLLAFDLLGLSDALAAQMGAVYFKRLFDFHERRRAALRAIVLRPPRTHRPTERCGGHQDRKLRQRWAFGVASLAWGFVPGLSTCALQAVFENAALVQLTCAECRGMLQLHIEEVTTEWAAVQTTI